MPKLSVLTPIYNTNETHLREMIESVLHQTFSDFEFIIVNNSPENPELKKIVKSYGDKRIKYFENERNVGISESYNRMIDMALGEYLAICEHDDISHKTRFEKQAAYLDANPMVGAVSAQIHFFPEDYTTQNPKTNRGIKTAMLSWNPIAHPVCMIRKSVLMENDIRYEKRFSVAMDYMLWVRLMPFTMFHNMDEVLLEYRAHDDRASIVFRQQTEDAAWEIAMIARNTYPVLWSQTRHIRKIKLFGFIPLIKIKRHKYRTWVYLFDFIPLFKIRFNDTPNF